MRAFENAVSAHITAPGGTDVTVRIEDRAFRTDVKITNDNAGNLPCGEIWCGPEEDGADGVIVIDGSIGDLGNVSKPLEITVKAGTITGLESEDQDLVQKVEELVNVDQEASVIGELGIGLNPGAKLTGNLLEDEKALDTAHIAFGNNEEMPGGRNRSKTHRDFLFYKPTFEVTFKDGEKRVLIREGRFIY
jgi:leucyl aminopeptidase (aminopeptidase T)